MLYELLLNISIFSSLLPVVAFIYLKREASSKLGLAILLLCLFSFNIEIIGQVVIINGSSNIFLSNLFSLISPFIILTFYLNYLKIRNSNFFIFLFLFLDSLSCFYLVIQFGIFNHFFKDFHVTNQFFILVLSLFYIFENFGNQRQESYFVLINYGFLINSSLSFLSILFLDSIISLRLSSLNFMLIWSIVLLSSIVFNLLLTLGIWKTKS